jgi:hypothetical protein
MLLEVLENKNDVAEDLRLKAKEWLEEICSNKQNVADVSFPRDLQLK